MTNQDKGGIRDADDLSGRDLQQSQAIAPSTGEFARDRMQDGSGGDQQGGGPTPSDMAAPGGSSGAGGYGQAQNQANHQGQQQAQAASVAHDGQDRGEAVDEQQGGGRDAASISRRAGSDPTEDRQLDEEADALLEDQQQHQDRGQGSIADAQQR